VTLHDLKDNKVVFQCTINDAERFKQLQLKKSAFQPSSLIAIWLAGMK
jgi:hypothetical protein